MKFKFVFSARKRIEHGKFYAVDVLVEAINFETAKDIAWDNIKNEYEINACVSFQQLEPEDKL